MPAYHSVWNSLEDARWLDENKPRLASSIVSLRWVRDGISGAERSGVQELVYMAAYHEWVFRDLVKKSWVTDGVDEFEALVIDDLFWIADESSSAALQILRISLGVDLLSAMLNTQWITDGIDDLETQAIDWIKNFSDADIASSVIGLAWAQDSIEEVEVKAIEELSYIANKDARLASSVLGLAWVRDGIEELEFEAIDWVNNFRDMEVASSVVALNWMQDGIEELEVKTVQELSYIAYDNSDIAAAVIAMGWVEDGVTDLEWEAIDWINNFDGGEVAASVVTLGWVQDDIQELEVRAIQELLNIYNDSRGLASAIVRMGWVRDGVTDMEFESIEWIGNFSNTAVASSVVALQWARDGIEELEVRAIEELSYIDYDSEELASAVVGLGWLQDGLADWEVDAIDWIGNFSDVDLASSVVGSEWVRDGLGAEVTRAIEELSYLANRDPDVASKVIAMPFLETLEASDVSALKSLAQLAAFREDDSRRVMAHPTLNPGISDDWAKIVATLYGVSKYDAESIDTLLNPDQVTIEERTIGLPLAGETQLAIIRTGPGAARSMDLLEHAVRHTEEFMQTAFPTGYVGYLFGDAVSGDSAGTNFGTHIASLAKYDVDDDSHEAEFTGHLIAHEVAHYYWRGNSDWIDEGAADFMGSVSENARTGLHIEVTNYPCGYARTIVELESLDTSRGDDAFTCNYALGERLFVDMYRSLGEDAFQQGLRNLYVTSRTVQADDEEAGIEHVRAAFKDVEGVDDQVIDVIAARWYEGTQPYDTSARDATPPDPRFSTVNGRINVAYLTATEDGPPITSISAEAVEDWVWLFLGFTYSVGSNTKVPLEIVTYFEDGFVFDRRPVSFDAEPRYSGAGNTKWWLRVGTSPDDPWAPGQYRVYVYNEGRKLVELEYRVTE